jgi:hypothetical protein
MRLRNVSEAAVTSVIRHGKVIETYEQDFPYPSYLVLGFVDEIPLHIVVADLESELSSIIITVYIPDEQTWDNGFARRRKQ